MIFFQSSEYTYGMICFIHKYFFYKCRRFLRIYFNLH